MATVTTVISYDDSDSAQAAAFSALVSAGATNHGNGIANNFEFYFSSGIVDGSGNYNTTGILADEVFYERGIFDGAVCHVDGILDYAGAYNNGGIYDPFTGNYYDFGIYDGSAAYYSGIFAVDGYHGSGIFNGDDDTFSETGIFNGTVIMPLADVCSPFA